MRLHRPTLSLLASAVGMAAFAPAAFAATVGCGDVITASTTLSNDLVGCGTPAALTIDGSGITLNLNGHEIVGTGTGTGVLVTAASSGAKVANGRVARFEIGVAAKGPGTALAALGIDGNTVDGVWLAGDGSRVTDSSFDRNGTGVEARPDAYKPGPLLHDPLIRANTIMRSTGSGVATAETTGARLERNTVGQNTTGISLSRSFSAVLNGNYVADNDGDGIHVDHDSSATMTSNSSLRNSREGVSVIDSYVDATGNTMSFNGADGFAFYDNYYHPEATRLALNRSNDNGGWGFNLMAGTTVLGGNVARRNVLGGFFFGTV